VKVVLAEDSLLLGVLSVGLEEGVEAGSADPLCGDLANLRRNLLGTTIAHVIIIRLQVNISWLFIYPIGFIVKYNIKIT
jgi:hypothetical protein